MRFLWVLPVILALCTANADAQAAPEPARIAQQIDALSSNGKVISSPIWVRPGGSIYIGSSNTVFSLAGTVFQVLIFDPKAVSGSLGNTDVTG